MEVSDGKVFSQLYDLLLSILVAYVKARVFFAVIFIVVDTDAFVGNHGVFLQTDR